MKPLILIVDDYRDTRELMARALESDYRVVTAPDATDALKALETQHDIALVLSDIRMPGLSGMDLLHAVKARYGKLPVILLTAYGTVDQAVSAMKMGAEDFLTKPIDLDKLEECVKKALRKKSEGVSVEQWEVSPVTTDEKGGLDNITGSSPAMKKVFDLVRQAAPTEATVLIQGPSGTGKELVAHAIHGLSKRAQGPFVAVHCAALTKELLESELFGHEKGAFTGAISRQIGRFEAAEHGTIFLDEISEIDPSTQVKLLRVLEERAFQRVGSVETLKADIRIVAATNRDLAAYVAEGKFREDLYYRLNVVDIHLPPLRERVGDIALITARYVKEFSEANGGKVTGITPEALQALTHYAWPGNVRELRNTIEKMTVLSSGGMLDVADVPESIRNPTTQGAVRVEHVDVATTANNGTLAENEKKRIFAVLDECEGNVSLAARKLGISRRTLYRRLDAYGSEKGSVKEA